MKKESADPGATGAARMSETSNRKQEEFYSVTSDRRARPVKVPRQRKRSGKPVPFASIRCKELDRIFFDQYGRVDLPDDDAGRDDVLVMLHHIARKDCKDVQFSMGDWLDHRAPWLAGAERTSMIADVLARPIKWKAEKLAHRLGLDAERRTRLRITTIGAIDQTKAQRKALSRIKERDRKRGKRRASGCRTIAEVREKSAKVLKPWEALGISRAKYYRLKKNTGEPRETRAAAA
jgi:hypothetical protein